ncbi:AT-hook motif nuclear-localized protein 10-like isoform X2 [Asparagus officinalis]|nr:AT-hook motif nuclear-localized protein 10-like isoform X2 [Asparagus officinalis]
MSMTVLPDGTCVYRHMVPPVPAAVTRGSAGALPLRVSLMKTWGRPRKSELFEYVPGGGTSSTTRVPSPLATRGPKGNASVDDAVPVEIVSPLAAIAAMGCKENAFTPYTIKVKAGQEISSILSSFCQKGHICVLSANGVVSQVVLHQGPSSGGKTYEGRFEILSISGLLPKSDSSDSETGGLTVLLAGSNGKVFGGRLAGLLLAASPIQMIIGSFASDCRQEASTGAKKLNLTSPGNLSCNKQNVSRMPQE